MFLPENKTLRKVLNNYKLAEFTADWDMNEGHSYEEKSMFIMDNKKTNGYFNIKNKKTFIGKEYKGDYEDTSKSTKTVFLKYNGKEYKEE